MRLHVQLKSGDAWLLVRFVVMLQLHVCMFGFWLGEWLATTVGSLGESLALVRTQGFTPVWYVYLLFSRSFGHCLFVCMLWLFLRWHSAHIFISCDWCLLHCCGWVILLPLIFFSRWPNWICMLVVTAYRYWNFFATVLLKHKGIVQWASGNILLHAIVGLPFPWTFASCSCSVLGMGPTLICGHQIPK